MLFGKEVGEEVGQLSAWTGARDVSRQGLSALPPGHPVPPLEGRTVWLPGHISQMGANIDVELELLAPI